MRGKIGVVVMAALLLLYLVLVTQLSFRLLAVDEPIGKAIGVALLVLPLLGLWALIAELMFGVRSQRLVGILGERGELPVDDLPKLTSGRPVREAADAEFPRYRAEVEQNPESWAAWFRLGLAYDAAGDRRRARAAIRRAIGMERRARSA
jgi:hypothetical protein